MTLDPTALAQLPLAALLLVLGTTFFGLLLAGRLRLEREVIKADAETAVWKDIAVKMTENAGVTAIQVKTLSESVATLTAVVRGHQA